MNSLNKLTKIIFVEGNIGSGKTSLIKYLKTMKKYESYNFILEPLSEYRNLVLYNESFLKYKNINNDTKTVNILDEFYNNKISAFHNQMHIISVLFLHILHNIKDDQINIVERSIFSAIYVFSKSMYNLNSLDIKEISIIQNYQKIFESFIQNKDISFLFLDIDYNICKERIVSRNRIEEIGITKDYLQMLDFCHKEMKNELQLKYKVINLNTYNKTIEETGLLCENLF